MKKLLLLFTAVTLSFISQAQYESRSIVFGEDATEFHNPVEVNKGVSAPVTHPLGFLNSNYSNPGAKKTSVGAPRWYSYYYTVDQLLGGTFTGSSSLYIQIPIWNDSAVTQLYYDGTRYYYGAINFCGIGQVIDPIHFQSYRDTDLLNAMYGLTSGAGQLLQVTDTSEYRVDSVRLQAGYIRISSKDSVVDTLILSVAPCNHAYVYGMTEWPMVSNIDLGTDTALVGFAPIAVDSDMRAANTEVPAYPEKKWKVLLHKSDGDTLFSVGGVPGYDSIKTFTYAVPGSGVKIPAGYDFVITATFKSGEPAVNIRPGIDSFNEYNHWMPVSGYEYARPGGGYMTYWYNQYNDQNSSNMLFPKKTSYYEPTIYVQAHNTNKNFDYQYHNIQAFITCPTCPSITDAPADKSFHHLGGITAVNNVKNIIGSVVAYPNPANTQLGIPFTLKQSEHVKIYLTNTIGQIVAIQNLGNVVSGRVEFNVSGFNSGIYFYTLEAGAEKATGRIAIVH